MKTLMRTCMFLLAATLASASLAEPNQLRTALEESKASGKGVSLLVNGQSIGGVVVAVDEHFVVARSQAQGTIVIRFDRIDGVAGFIGQPGSERKAP